MIERQIEIPTADGATSTFVTCPERDGPFPVVVFLMDAPAIREELRDMARRIASVGYYVILPNLYYRAGVMELGPIPPEPEAPSRRQMFDLMNSLTIPMVLDDVAAMLAFADGDANARASQVAVIGYCMSGRFAVCSAARWPDRVRATASIYGVRLVTSEEDSPHLVAKSAPAEFYFACAETDHWAPPEMVAQLQSDLAGAHGEVELYPGTQHGFAFPKRPAYDKPAAERHWERLFALFERNL